MKKTILIIATILIVLLASCSQEIPVEQVLKGTRHSAFIGTYTAQKDNGKYEIAILNPGEGFIVELKVWTKDYLTGEWPENPILYTGTVTITEHEDVISETPTLIEKDNHKLMKITFNSVSNPDYNSTLHVYDGVFDCEWISGYKSSVATDGRSIRHGERDGIVRLVVCPNSDEAPSALIGVGDWTCKSTSAQRY